MTVAVKRPIPLEVDLAIATVDDGWHLVDPGEPDQPVLVATPWTPDYADTDPVSLADAADARTRFPLHDDHPVPVCFSCGANADSMQVHSGPLKDGRWATDWTVPEWAIDADGTVDEGALWAAIDCAQAWYAGNAGGRRHAVTVQLAVEVIAPLEAGARYSLVAWNGTYPEPWDGRKRGAGGAGVRQRWQLRRPIQQFLDRYLASAVANNQPFTRLAGALTGSRKERGNCGGRGI